MPYKFRLHCICSVKNSLKKGILKIFFRDINFLVKKKKYSNKNTFSCFINCIMLKNIFYTYTKKNKHTNFNNKY